MCHSAANTRPITITRFGKFGVQKNSRMARRYARPATDSGMRGNASPCAVEVARADGQPGKLNNSEPVQPVRGSELHRPSAALRSAAAPLATVSATPRFAAPAPAQAGVPRQAGPSRPPRQCRRTGSVKPTESCSRRARASRASSALLVPIPSPWKSSVWAAFAPTRIIAAVMRRSNNQVVRGEHLECVRENGNRQVRAVAVEGDHAVATSSLRSARTPTSTRRQPLPLAGRRQLSPLRRIAPALRRGAGSMMATFTSGQRICER